MSRSVEAQGLAALLNLDAHLEMGRISAGAEQSAAVAVAAATASTASAPAPREKTPAPAAETNRQKTAEKGADDSAALLRATAAAPTAVPADTFAATNPPAAGPTAAPAPALGRIGPYELKDALAHDGLGQVFKAWDTNENIDVMLTLLDLESDARDREVIIAQLQQSVLAASRLQHPGLARIHDAGVVGAGVYIVNLWLPGRTLAQAQLAGWQPTARVAAQMVHDLAQALAYAHANGVLHGGLNPSTVLLDSDDKATALGLGFACPAHASDLPSMDPLVSGAAPYLAPEQLQGGAVDVRTDVHALGVLLYELLAGHRAYPGETVPEVARALMAHDPAPPHWLRLDVPERLSAIAMQALQRNPAARYAQASEVAMALQAWLQQAEQETDEARVAFVAAQAAPKPPLHRKSYGVAASLLVATGLVLAWAWADRQDSTAALGVPATPAVVVAADGAARAAPVPAGDGGAAGAGTPPGATAAAPAGPTAASAADAADGADGAADKAARSLEPAAGATLTAAAAVKPEPAQMALQPVQAGPVAPGLPTAQVPQPSVPRQPVTEPLLSTVGARLVTTGATPSPAVAVTTPAATSAAPLLAQADSAVGARPAARPTVPAKLPPSGPTAAPPNAAKTAVRDKPRATPDARAPVVPAAVPTGTVQLAVSPWGYVEVGGKLAGASPPLHMLTLPEGSHTITIRNEDFAPFVTTVQVTADKAATVRHRFSQ